MGLRGGVVICAPVPKPYAMPEATMDAAIEQALSEMAKLGIRGKDTTPYLLQRISEITSGDSLATNIQLVLNNAGIAAQIAGAM